MAPRSSSPPPRRDMIACLRPARRLPALPAAGLRCLRASARVPRAACLRACSPAACPPACYPSGGVAACQACRCRCLLPACGCLWASARVPRAACLRACSPSPAAAACLLAGLLAACRAVGPARPPPACLRPRLRACRARCRRLASLPPAAGPAPRRLLRASRSPSPTPRATAGRPST